MFGPQVMHTFNVNTDAKQNATDLCEDAVGRLLNKEVSASVTRNAG